MKRLLIFTSLGTIILFGAASAAMAGAESANAARTREMNANLLHDLEKLTAEICNSSDLGPKDGEPIKDTPCYKLAEVRERLLAMGVQEPCTSLRAQNAGVSWAALTPLPLRCVPMNDRVNKVYDRNHTDVPKGWECREDIFYDKKGRAGLVCSPATLVNEWTLNRPCEEEDFNKLPHWTTIQCRGYGTGLQHCDDGKIAISIDAQTYCHISVFRHTR